MRDKGPATVTLIGCFNIIAAIALIIPVFVKSLRVVYLPLSITIFSENITRIMWGIILLIISYGYIKLTGWGFWLMTAYLAIPLVIFYFEIIVYHRMIRVDVIFNTLFLIYTFYSRHYFGKRSGLAV